MYDNNTLNIIIYKCNKKGSTHVSKLIPFINI